MAPEQVAGLGVGCNPGVCRADACGGLWGIMGSRGE